MSALDDVIHFHEDNCTLGSECDLSALSRAELAALRQRIAELEAQAANDYWRKQYDQLAAAIAELHEWDPLEESSILKPRQCCAKCDARAEAVREAAAKMCGDKWDSTGDIETIRLSRSIRAMPLPPCADCNPLAPKASRIDRAKAAEMLR